MSEWLGLEYILTLLCANYARSMHELCANYARDFLQYIWVIYYTRPRFTIRGTIRELYARSFTIRGPGLLYAVLYANYTRCHLLYASQFYYTRCYMSHMHIYFYLTFGLFTINGPSLLFTLLHLYHNLYF